MMFTPKGWSVRRRQRRICARKASASMPPPPIRPIPPALETAAAKGAVAMLAMPPWIRGNSVPKSSFKFIVSLTRIRAQTRAE